MTTLTFIKRIGQGGFGDVDLVLDADGSYFARKTFAQNQPLPPALLENVVRRFKKEARIQGGIAHDNIVPVVGKDLDAEPPYYLMPVAEASLQDDLEQDRTLGGTFVSAMSDIVAALTEMHSMEIYHRDLKPGNVLRFLRGDNGAPTYAVSDFGLISQRESQLSGLTTTGMRKGSDHYTAPEIATDLRKASASSDIYSLGCILHDMVGTEERVPCGEIKEQGPFSAILAGCTRREPSKRFKSVGSVLDAILSVEFAPLGSPSQESVDFIAILEADSPPPPNVWMRLADFLEREASDEDRMAVFGKLGLDRIEELCKSAPEAAERIGSAFARWVSTSSFNFEYCDALANRLEAFFESTKFDTKVDCLMALLLMGTSHNRWFVERKFARICNSEMDDNLAKRLAVEFRIAEADVCEQISHLEASISFARSGLHPALVKALGDVCP